MIVKSGRCREMRALGDAASHAGATAAGAAASAAGKAGAIGVGVAKGVGHAGGGAVAEEARASQADEAMSLFLQA